MLKQLVHDRNERRQTIAECQSDIRLIEEKVVSHLVKTRHFEMFSVNWGKLNRMLNAEVGPDDA